MRTTCRPDWVCSNTVNSVSNILFASETGTVSETQSPDEETGLLEALNEARKLLTKETVSGVGLTN